MFARKIMERRQSEKCFVSIYQTMTLISLKQELDLLEFISADNEWLDFVFENRSGTYAGKTYDAIIGPVADDVIYRTFIAYEAGILTKEETIKRLKVKKLYNQMTFASEKALFYLNYKGHFEP